MLPPIRADGKRRADAVSAPFAHGVAQEHHDVGEAAPIEQLDVEASLV